DAYDLSMDELAEYYFKKGYCNFQLENYEQASTAFFEIKDTDNAYTSPA
ncbi:MAG: hypothetical protein GW818_07760, partial [Flavobacteriales bacterium]|nr:hypothetical protein [Flavobacteriales bacterium]